MLHLFQTHRKNFPLLFRFLVKFCSLNNNLADKSLLSALVMQTRFKLSKYKQNISKFWKEIMNNRRCVWNLFLLWICPFHIEAKLIFTDILNDTLYTGIMLHLHLGKLVYLKVPWNWNWNGAKWVQMGPNLANRGQKGLMALLRAISRINFVPPSRLEIDFYVI